MLVVINKHCHDAAQFDLNDYSAEKSGFNIFDIVCKICDLFTFDLKLS